MKELITTKETAVNTESQASRKVYFEKIRSAVRKSRCRQEILPHDTRLIIVRAAPLKLSDHYRLYSLDDFGP